MIRLRDGYELSDDAGRLDVEAIWRFLRTAYWSPKVPRDVVERAIANSVCVGLYAPTGEQAGFARAVTDGATFAWIADVFVLDAHRGAGLGVWMVGALLDHPALAGVRRTLLATADAHGLYARFGFAAIDEPGRLMDRWPRGAKPYGTPAEKATE